MNGKRLSIGREYFQDRRPMRGFSLATGLVLRQVLFLTIIVTLGVTAIFMVAHVRDAVAALFDADPAQIHDAMVELTGSADRVIYTLIFSPLFACAVILGVSMPILHKTLSQPLARLARQMTE